MDEPLFDTLARVAHETSPPSLRDEDHLRMVEEAMRSSELPRAQPKAFARVAFAKYAFASAALLMLAVASTWWLLAPPQQTAALTKQAPLLTSMSPSGDVLSALPGSQFDVESAHELRRYRLREGAILFDVAALAEGETFTVLTEEVEVRVRGTVFSVERFGGASRVHVYEGRVEIETPSGDVHFLDAHMTWAVGASESLFPRSELLVAAGLAAAERRELALPAPIESDVPMNDHETDVPETDANEPTERAEQAIAMPLPAQRQARLRRGDVRTWLGTGEYERARLAASQHDWPRLEGDALRALGRFEEAVRAYDEVGDSGAAYDAAVIRFRQLEQPAESLATLMEVDDASDVAERALALRVRLLLHLHREGDAREAAADYRRRFPAGSAIDWVQRVD